MSLPRRPHLDTLAVSLLLACCLFWGFQQVLVKATVAEVAPVFQAALRFGVALLLLWGWCLWRGVPLWRRDGSLATGLLAGALFAGEFICIYAGLQFTHASRLTVFLYAAPFWLAVLLPRFVPGERLRGAQWIGLACAFTGVLLALGDGGAAPLPRQWLGDLLGLLAGLLWALTTVVIRATPVGRLAPEKQLFYQVGVSALLLPLVSLLLGESWRWNFSAFALGSLALQALVGAFLSYLAWMWMLAHYPATRLSVFVFLTPVFALLTGALWLHEPVTLGFVTALALVAAGIVLVNRRPRVAAATPGQ
ncbi:DMT family transporter [Xylophilus sp. ASV27]|uniref:DMT family transporter n=1 Tax=Xylophilus sp. ASV27 TaxID=2795129 RepID=UPI0018EB1249|nr:DMT family transporter [Xylophilus sp. ASV27]